MKKILLFSFIVLFTVGCTQHISSETRTDSPKIKVVTSFYPLSFMAEQIGGKNVEVVNLAGSQDVHEYEPSPQDIVKLNQANLVILQGMGLEFWAEDVIPTLKKSGVLVIKVSHNLDLLEKKEDDHQEEEHHHGKFNPHTWLDPVLAQKMVQNILTSLIKIDPQNTKIYKENAKKLNKKFIKLDQSFQSQLTQCGLHEVIISHDAIGYLEDRYHFKAYAIAGISTKDTPSAKILAELKEKSKKGVTHILVEENSIQKFADILAQETGLKILPFNPLGQGTLDSDKDFFDVMNENLINLKISLNCK